MKTVFIVLVVVCAFLYVIYRYRKRNSSTTDNNTTATTTTIGSEDKPITTAQPIQTKPSTLKVKSIRLRARDGQPERAVVCSEVKLLLADKWLRPISGSVSTVAPGHSDEWRQLDDDSNSSRSYVHTDTTTPGNTIVLNYANVEADRVALWTRTDYLQSGADHMFNVDVEVIGDDNKIVWKKQLNKSLFSDAGKSYNLDFQSLPSD